MQTINRCKLIYIYFIYCYIIVSQSGQLSVQRAILEVQKYRSKYKESVDGFVEEAVVRRELADNFCYYNKNYDKVEGKGLLVSNRMLHGIIIVLDVVWRFYPRFMEKVIET